MSVTSILLIGLAIGLVALLYSSVGHAGASGYIAVMALAGMSDETIRPTALVLNIVVAAIATWQFASQGHFSWKLFWPFAVAAIPMAFVGGYYQLPTSWFHLLVGMILLFSAIRLIMPSRESEVVVAPKYYLSIPTGGVLGLLAGLTGTGGGIFLTPLILLMGWANPKCAGAVSAPFILCNSLAGLAGNLSQTLHLPDYVSYWGAIVLLAGFAGSRMGSKRLPSATIKQLLAAVLIIAGSKLVVSGLASWL